MLWDESVWQLRISGEVWHQALWRWCQCVLPPRCRRYHRISQAWAQTQRDV